MSWDEPISPELALVDPDLARRLRAAMTVDYAVQTTVERRVVSPAAQAEAAHPAPLGAGSPQKLRASGRVRAVHLAHASTVGLVVFLVVLPFLAFLAPRQEPSLATSPASTTDPATKLAWPADPHATYYVVQLLRENRLLHVSLPVTPTARLPQSLRAGSYTWRVYAGHGPIDANRRSGPIAQGTFTIEGG